MSSYNEAKKRILSQNNSKNKNSYHDNERSYSSTKKTILKNLDVQREREKYQRLIDDFSEYTNNRTDAKGYISKSQAEAEKYKLASFEQRANEFTDYLNDFSTDKRHYSAEELDSMLSNLSQIAKMSKENSAKWGEIGDYYSQFEDEKAYKSYTDDQTFSKKYAKSTYSDLQKAKADIEKQLSEKDDETLNRELYWLQNHDTDRQYVDKMSKEELENLKNADKVKRDEANAKYNVAKYNYDSVNQTNGIGRVVAGVIDYFSDDYKNPYTTAQNEFLKASSEKEKADTENGTVLYTTDDGVGITADTLLNMRAADEKFNTKNIDSDELKKDLEVMNRARLWLSGQQSDVTKTQLDYENSSPQAKEDMEYLKSKYNIDDNALPYDVYETVKDLEEYAKWRIDSENFASEQKKNTEYATEHPVLATVKSIATAPLTALEFAENVLDGSDFHKGEYGSHNLVNIYDDKYLNQNQTYQSTVADMIDEKVMEKTDSELLSWLSSGAYSGVTSSAQSALTTGACMLMFGGAGGAVALGIMGTEAAASSYNNAIMNGSTNGEAILTAVSSGIAEAAFEKISLDKLIDIGKMYDVSSMSALIKSMIKNSGATFVQGGVEASEEFFTEITNKLADEIINGDHSAYNTAVAKYKKMGYSDTDAKQIATKDAVLEVFEALYGGFIGGIGSGAGASVVQGTKATGEAVANEIISNRYYNQMGQNIVTNEGVQDLIGKAKGTNSLRKLADKVAGVKSEDLTDDKSVKKYEKNVGKLYKGVTESQLKKLSKTQASETEINSFKELVKAELESAGVENADKVTDVIVKSALNIGKLTREESGLFNSVNGRAVINKVLQSENLKVEEGGDLEQVKSEINSTRDLAKFDLDNFLTKKLLSESAYKVSTDGRTTIQATDEEVDRLTIDSLDGEDVSVKVKTGDSEQIVLASELRLSEDYAVIIESLKNIKDKFGLDVESANNVLALWESFDGSSAVFATAVKSGLMYGQYNMRNEFDKNFSVSKIPENIRNRIFEIGREYKQRVVDEQEADAKTNGNANAKKGEFSIKYAKGVTYENLNKSQKAQIDFAQVIAQIFGFNLEIFRSPKNALGKSVGENGSYHLGTNTMRLDIDAGTLDGKSLILFTQSHELTHFIKKWSPKAFKTFADLLVEKYESKGVSVEKLVNDKIIQSIINRGKDHALSYDEAFEEVVCDACEDFLADPNIQQTITEFAKVDENLAQKIKDFLKGLITKVEEAIKGLQGQSKEASYLREFDVQDLEDLKICWTSALFDARENVLQAKENKAEKNTIDEKKQDRDFIEETYDSLSSAKNENGDELFQYRAIQHDVPEYRAMLEKYSDMSSAQIDALFETMNKAFAIIEDNLEILDYAWDENLNEDGTWDDTVDARAFNPVKPNSDKLYKYSLDFSTMCRKRLLQQVIAEELSLALDRAVTKAEGIAIRNELIKLQEEGRQIEIACALCYVESARMKSPEQIQKFLNDAGQMVREFFATKAKSSIAEAEEKARKSVAKKYAKEIKEGSVSPTDTFTTKGGKVKYIPLSKLPKKMKDEIHKAKREAKSSYSPSAEEQRLIDIASNLPVTAFTTAEGLKNLAKDNPVIFDAYTSFVRNATHSKGTEKDVWYRVGDANKIGDDIIAAMNKENGLRSQSWSDFQVIHLLDYVGAIIELSTKKAKMQAYTKVPDYVNLMGLTGQMINLSLIPARDFNGKLEFDSVEGMAFEVARKLRDKYPDTAGTISIGITNEQIQMLLDSIDIDYVIPYHHSAMSKVVRKAMHIPSWVTYQDYQNEKNITSKKDALANAKKYGVQLLNTSDERYHKAPSFSEWFDLEEARQVAQLENLNPTDLKAQKKYGVMYGAYKAMQQAADNYLKICAERGLVPKFCHEKADFTVEDNYWKLLIDRKMINQKTGEIIEQKPVQPIFNEGEVLNILNNEIARYEDVKKDFDYATRIVTERFLNGDMNEHISEIAKAIGDTVTNVTKVAILNSDIKHQDRDSTGRELTPEQAAEYLELAKNPEKNEARLREMVAEAAKKAGYNSPKLYHGTAGFGFTKIKTSGVETGVEWSPFFATNNIYTALTYSGVPNKTEIGKKKRPKKSFGTLRDEASMLLSNSENATTGFVDAEYRDSYIEQYGDIMDEGIIRMIKAGVEGAFAVNGSEFKFVPYEDGFTAEDYDSKFGNYGLYAKTEGFLVIDGENREWNKLHSEYGSTTRLIAKNAHNDGYKGVIIRNVYDTGWNWDDSVDEDVDTISDVFVFFNPESQIKSADPVTYDDNGNIIPLSERFNEDNDDIRYQDRDYTGREFADNDIKFSIREEAPPVNTVKGYKVFVVKDGKLYPPMVANPGGADTPIGVWLNADIGASAPDSKTGRKQVKAGGKGTQGGSGSLAFRPGWHLGEVPIATQFNRLNAETGVKELFPANFVWAECDVAADFDYQEEAMSYGYTENGKFRHSYAGLPRLPVDGYYKYRTNPNPDTVPWLITGAMKVNRVLSDAEVAKILRENNIEPPKRQGGEKTLKDLGLERFENVSYQDRPYQPSLEDLGIDYKAENEHLKADVDRLKEMLKLQGTVTHGKALAKASYEGVAKKLLHEFGMKRVTDTELLKEFISRLDSFYSYIINSDDLVWEDMFDKSMEIARWLDNKLPEQRVYKNPYAVEILRDIREKGIMLSDKQKEEAAYYAGSLAAYRKMNIGSFKIVNEGGISLTDLWERLVTDYPGAISQEYIEQGEVAENLPSLIVEVIEVMRQTDNVINDDNRLSHLREMATAIYDSYWNVPTVRTLADKHQQKVNLLKGQHKAEMDALKEKKDSEIKDTKAYYQDMVKKIRADKDAKMDAYRERVREQNKKNVEGRNKTATKNKIKRVIKTLASLYGNPTKEKNVKIEFQDMVKDALILADALFDGDKTSSTDILSGNLTIRLGENEKKKVNEWRAVYKARQDYRNNLDALESSGKVNQKTHDELLDMINRCNNKLNRLGRDLSDVVERQKAELNEDSLKNAIGSLVKAYKSLKESPEGYAQAAYNDFVAKRLETLEESLAKTTVKSMTLTQLEELYQAYKMVLTTVRTANEIFVKNKRMSVVDMGEAVISEVKKVANPTDSKVAALKGVREFSWEELKPVYAFERIGSETFMQLYKEVLRGQGVVAQDIAEAQAFFDKMNKTYGYDSWDLKETKDFKLADGRTFTINLQEIMSIYAYSKREQALDHITNGGFVFDNKEFFTDTKEKGLKGKIKKQRTTVKAYRINDEMFYKIINSLTKEQKKFAEEMQDYLTSMGEKGNEVSRVLYGIDIFNEKHYFPLMSSKAFIQQTNEPVGTVTLKNSGMTKATVPHARNPIVLQGFMDVWANHINKMSTYHGLVLPIENLNKVFNYTGYAHEDESVSVETILSGAYGDEVNKYIENFITDLNGGIKTQSSGNWVTKGISLFKKTAVAASISVVVQQPTAIVRAMAMINPKYFVHGKDGIKHNEAWEKIKKYAPIAIVKEMGGFDVGSGRQVADYITAKEYKGKDKVKGFFTDSTYRDDALMWGATKADEFGWITIWNAVEKEIADTTTYKVGSEEFLQACGERFTEVIDYTQVYDSVLSRSGFMRNKGEISKMATSFMGEPTTSFNMLYNAVLQAKRGNIGKGEMTKIMGATISSIILASIAKSLIYALRDDDEDESYLEKYAQSLTNSLMEDLFIPNMLPYVRDITSLFSGWDVERTDMAILKDLKDAIDGLDSSNKSLWRKIEDLGGAVAAFGGIPAKNVMRTVREMYNLMANILDDNTASASDVGDAIAETITGETSSSDINEALEKGKTDKAKEIINDLVADKVEQGKTQKEAKASVKASITSYWKALYIQAYRDKDDAEMLRIRQILQSTGLYDNVIETCQNWIKNMKDE